MVLRNAGITFRDYSAFPFMVISRVRGLIPEMHPTVHNAHAKLAESGQIFQTPILYTSVLSLIYLDCVHKCSKMED